MFAQIESCGNCKFYHTSTKSCRRYPPEVLVAGVKQTIANPGGEPVLGSFFPQMASNGWCGEHALKEEQPNA